jgi:acyl-CoA thioester hydrolase
MPLILARVELDFRAPIFFGDEVGVESKVDRIGRSSFDMRHRMTAGADGRLVGDAHTVLVTYDYAAARPMPVPDEWRRLIADHEGTTFETDAPRAEPVAS